jgi:anaerobic ribonucleoside-triphosphate reductase
VAFETRLAKYIRPNRTMASYLEGKQKKTHDNILVRGYWADIMMSPYWSFGINVDCCQDCHDVLFKKAND